MEVSPNLHFFPLAEKRNLSRVSGITYNDGIYESPAAFTPCVSVSEGFTEMLLLPATFIFFSNFVETTQVYFSEFR